MGNDGDVLSSQHHLRWVWDGLFGLLQLSGVWPAAVAHECLHPLLLALILRLLLETVPTSREPASGTLSSGRAEAGEGGGVSEVDKPHQR